jgi:hypothetical protein
MESVTAADFADDVLELSLLLFHNGCCVCLLV